MPRDDLRRKLEALHEELARAPQVDGTSKDLLQDLAKDIQRVLDREAEDHEHESIIDRLREEVQRFEDSHPTLAAALGRIADTLSNLGI